MSEFFVICVDNSEYPASLVQGKRYKVLPRPIEGANKDQIRVVDESGEDYIYPVKFFEPWGTLKEGEE